MQKNFFSIESILAQKRGILNEKKMEKINQKIHFSTIEKSLVYWPKLIILKKKISALSSIIKLHMCVEQLFKISNFHYFMSYDVNV